MKAPRSILLVEDIEPLRKLAHTVLTRAGFRVFQAADGEDALRVAVEQKEPFDLLVTDMTMPNMGGRQLGAALRRLQPEIRILYMSGTEENVDLVMNADGKRHWYLSKPFMPEELVAMVREILKELPADDSRA